MWPKKIYPKEKCARKFTLPAQLLVLHLVIDRPSVYLNEIQNKLETTLQLHVSKSTLCKFLHQCGFSRQKISRVALQQDQLLRSRYALEMTAFSENMFVFVDESGADQRNLLRKYGYSIRGKTPRSYDFLVRGETISAVASMSYSGLLDVKTVRGTTDGDEFYLFVQTNLLPHLLPFNGINSHSIVVMDNCSIHHVNEVVQSIEDVGALVIFLPPYSPDYNPIEELFSKIKYVLKRKETDMDHTTDLQTALFSCFMEVTNEDCCAWIDHCEIY